MSFINNQPFTISVFYFAGIRDIAKISRIEMEIPGEQTIMDIKRKIGELNPDLQIPIMKAIASINHRFAFDMDPIPAGAEVAFFPAVSGGQQRITIAKIVEKALDINEIVHQITLETTGAVCTFTGIVRGKTERGHPQETRMLNYEAYIPMAEGKMSQIAEEIRSRWSSIEGIAIIQRIGCLMPGVPTIVVACAASHRDTGVFEAASYGIDRVKEIVPIWKKEINRDGEYWSEGHYMPEPGD
jgi:molybdopterin synthase catalytic subunit